MNAHVFIDALLDSGWIKEGENLACAEKVAEANIPHEIAALCSQYSALRNPDETIWLYSIQDYAGFSDSGFEWDFFEKSSLECALDAQQKRAVQIFWREHVPFGASVADGYAYLAYRWADGAIVMGSEPEYENSAEWIADSLTAFFELFAAFAREKAEGPIGRFLGQNAPSAFS